MSTKTNPDYSLSLRLPLTLILIASCAIRPSRNAGPVEQQLYAAAAAGAHGRALISESQRDVDSGSEITRVDLARLCDRGALYSCYKLAGGSDGFGFHPVGH